MNAPPIAPSFGDRLRVLREQRGLTQTDLSRDSGISQSTVSALETGRQRPWPSTRRALARAFGMALEEFDQHVMPERRAGMPSDPVSIEIAAESSQDELARSVARLVDQLRLSEMRLRRSEQQLGLIRRLIDEAPVLCWETDADLRVMAAWGWAAKRHEVWGDLVGRTLAEFHARTGGAVPLPPVEPHRRALSGVPISLVMPWGSDEWLVVLEPHLSAESGVSGVLGMAVRRFA